MDSIVINIPADAAQKAAKATEVETKYWSVIEETRAQRALVDAMPKTKTGKYTKVANELLKTLADKQVKAREDRESQDAVEWDATAVKIAYSILDGVNNHSKFKQVLEDFGWHDVTKTVKPDYNQRREMLASIPTRKSQMDWTVELKEHDHVYFRAGQLYGIYIVIGFNPEHSVPCIKFNGYMSRIGSPRWNGRRVNEHVDDGHDEQHFFMREGRLIEANDVLRHGHFNQPGTGSYYASEWLLRNADLVSVLQMVLAWREEVREINAHDSTVADVIRLAVLEGKALELRRVTYKQGESDDYHYKPMRAEGLTTWFKDVLVVASDNADYGVNSVRVDTLANIRLTPVTNQ